MIATALLLTAADSMWGQVLWLCGIGAVAALNFAGRPLTERARRHVASACVGAFAIYVAASIGGAVAAKEIVRRNVDEPIERLMVGPLPLTPARREVVVADARPRSATGDSAGSSRPASSGPIGRGLACDRMRSWTRRWRDPSIRGFVGWARFPWAEIDDHPDFWEVHLMDARYTLERGARFGSVMVRVPKEP